MDNERKEYLEDELRQEAHWDKVNEYNTAKFDTWIDNATKEDIIELVGEDEIKEIWIQTFED